MVLAKFEVPRIKTNTGTDIGANLNSLERSLFLKLNF